MSQRTQPSPLPTVCISDLNRHEGQEVRIRGWLYNKRCSGKIQFFLLRDGTGIAQGVARQGESPAEVLAHYDELTQESAVTAAGVVRRDERAPGGYELTLTDLTLVHRADEYPITPKSHGISFLLDHRHLWLRSKGPRAILRVRHELVQAIRDFFYQQGFVLIDTPILTGAIAEGAGSLFEIDYFDLGKAYLAQTGQLYLEAAAAAFGRVYCFGPTFRAEKSKTRRHLIEFWMAEAEMAYADQEANMAIQEELISSVVARILDRCEEELKTLGRDVTRLEQVRRPFIRLSYDEAVERLQAAGAAIQWGEDLGGDDQTVLSQEADRPLFIVNYPLRCKAFYMERDSDRPDVALCSDLLAPEGYGEIIGGSQRIADYDFLLQRIREEKLPEEAHEWYLDLRRYGSVPHSGFGLGIERMVAWICGVSHVRETIPFPRLLNRLHP